MLVGVDTDQAASAAKQPPGILAEPHRRAKMPVMRLSPQAQEALHRAAQAFVSNISGIISDDTVSAVRDVLGAHLAALSGREPAPRSSSPTPRTRPRRAGRRASVERLVDLIKIAGGQIAPRAVSKQLGIGSPARRRLVGKAVEAGLVRTTGKRRNTLYVLT